MFWLRLYLLRFHPTPSDTLFMLDTIKHIENKGFNTNER